MSERTFPQQTTSEGITTVYFTLTTGPTGETYSNKSLSTDSSIVHAVVDAQEVGGPPGVVMVQFNRKFDYIAFTKVAMIHTDVEHKDDDMQVGTQFPQGSQPSSPGAELFFAYTRLVDGEITTEVPDEGLVFQCMVTGKLSPK